MFTKTILLDFHKRVHHNLKDLLDHCQQFSYDDLNRKLDGFGFPTLREQIHHAIGAEEYWISVVQGNMVIDDNFDDYPTIDALEAYRQKVFDFTEGYLDSATPEELNTTRLMMTWGNKERMLVPGHIFMRTMTHIYHHIGQMSAMCRLLGQPVKGFNYPIIEAKE